MRDLTYRRVSPNGYRVSFDGVEVGSISQRSHHKRKEFWHWGVDIMPLRDHGGRPPSGDVDTFEDALSAFKLAFMKWHAALPPGLWEKNRDHIAHGSQRWRNR